MARPPKKSKRFEYNLESALKFRDLRENQAKDAFNEAERKYKEELNKEEALKAQEASEHQGLLAEISEGKTLDFQQILMRKAHLETLKVKITEQVQVRVEAEKEKQEKHEALIQAMKDKKILEEDKEKKREQWKALMKKEELKFLDEIATIGFVRQSREEEEEWNRVERNQASLDQ